MNAILHTVIIYTLASCPYCIKAKHLLDKKNVVYQEIEISNFTEEQRKELRERAGGSKTVPQIFVHIGGYDDLNKLEQEGKLDELLKR